MIVEWCPRVNRLPRDQLGLNIRIELLAHINSRHFRQPLCGSRVTHSLR